MASIHPKHIYYKKFVSNKLKQTSIEKVRVWENAKAFGKPQNGYNPHQLDWERSDPYGS
jgi:hypothetical protein